MPDLHMLLLSIVVFIQIFMIVSLANESNDKDRRLRTLETGAARLKQQVEENRYYQDQKFDDLIKAVYESHEKVIESQSQGAPIYIRVPDGQ